MEYKFLSTAIYKAETEIEVPAGESTEIIIDYVESDASALKLSCAYTLNPYLYLSNYNPKIQIGAEIQYIAEDTEDDLIYTCVNRETTESLLELKGKDFNCIILTIYNNSASSIIFSKFEVYQSQDVSPTQIATLFYEDIVAANAIKATTVISEGLITDFLITNALSRSIFKAKAGDIVNYITIENIEIGFYTAVLGSETEQFSLTTTTAGITTKHLYWWQSIEGENAYKYPTTIDPRDRIPGISDSDRDAFRLMVYKPDFLAKKGGFEFSYDKSNNLTPALNFGSGDGEGNCVGYIFKDTDGFYQMYKQVTGKEIGIVMDDTGLYLQGVVNRLPEYVDFRKEGYFIKKMGAN